jgi:hypothetical protein
MSLGEQERERQRRVHRAQLEAIRRAFGANGGPASPGGGGGPGGGGPGGLGPGGETPSGGGPDEPGPPWPGTLEARINALTARAAQIERRSRRSVRAALTALVTAAASVALFWAPAGWLPPRAAQYADLVAGALSVDHLLVRGQVELVDESGRRLAFLGREPADVGGPAPVAFGLYGDDAEGQVLRMAASSRGAALSLEAPEGESSLSLVALAGGAQIDLRDGEITRQLGAEPPAALPEVAAAPVESALREIPEWRPQASDPARGPVANAIDVGDGFVAVDLALVESDAGAELTGRMVNGTALTHHGLAFRVTIDGVTESFTIPKISPGNSTGFSLRIPGATSAPVTPPSIAFLGSTIGFQANSIEPRHARLEAR